MIAPPLRFRFRGQALELGGRPKLMGVVNATPDSFSDAGLHPTLEERVELARSLIDAGAELIDIGGESGVTNRPPVRPAEEIERVVPLVRRVLSSRVKQVPLVNESSYERNKKNEKVRICDRVLGRWADRVARD